MISFFTQSWWLTGFIVVLASSLSDTSAGAMMHFVRKRRMLGSVAIFAIFFMVCAALAFFLWPLFVVFNAYSQIKFVQMVLASIRRMK